MTIMIVNNRKYKIHPVYDAYGASKRGDVINKGKNLVLEPNSETVT